jgi:hypothetical protein
MSPSEIKLIDTSLTALGGMPVAAAFALRPSARS